MELPIRVELAKLSHVHALGLLLPFVPGIVVTVGLMLGHSIMVEHFATLSLGYNTKLAVAVVLTYIIGLAMMTVMQICTDAVMMQIRPPSQALPWDNSYWRRVATSYLGSALLPDGASASSQDLERVAKYMLAIVRKPSVQFRALTPVRESIERQEEVLKKANDLLANGGQVDMDALASVRQNIAAHKSVLEEADRELRTVVTDVEWLSLHSALNFLPSDVQHPYESFKLLMSCLQAAAIGSIWLMMQFRELWNSVVMSFAIILFLATSHALWLSFQMNRYLADYASGQIAAMIQQLRQRSDQKEGSKSK